MVKIDEAMLEYYRVYGKRLKPMPSESQLSDFYHPSEGQKNGELLFIAVGTGIATCSVEELKQNDRQRKTMSSILLS